MWTFNLFGAFSLTAPDGASVTLPGMKHRALVAFLVSSRHRSVSRSNVRELLWGLRSDGQSRASLRGVLSEIRGALRPFYPLPIAADRHRIYLTAVPVKIDVVQLSEAIRATSIEDLQKAVGLYKGDFLGSVQVREEVFEEWKAGEQFRWRKIYSQLLTKLLGALWNRDKPSLDLIEDVANQLLEMNAADEDAHRSLMLLYAHQGKQQLALEQFETCRRQLRNVGALPSCETSTMFDDIRTASIVDWIPDTGPKTRVASSVIASSARESFGTSVAVTPFVSVDCGDEGTRCGMQLAEDTLGAATRFRWFRVVPRRESFNEQLVGNGPLAVARDTGAKYILEGRLRRTSGGYILAVELIDSTRRTTVWNEKLDLPGGEFADREDVVAKISSRLDEQLRASEMDYARESQADEFSPYECTLLAISSMYDMRRANYDDAERLFNLAVRKKPDHSSIYSFWSLWKMWCVGQGWSDNQGSELIEAGELARKAIARDPSDALALAISGHFESFWNKNFDHGAIQFERSLSNNPYSSFGWMLSSATCSYRGMCEEAIRRLDYAESLCSVTPPLEFMYSMARCVAHNFNRDFEEARIWG